MASVKSILNCAGVDTGGDVSVLYHGFGFVRARVPTDPDPTVRASVSLLDHLRGLKGHYINLNVIRVGIDNFTNNEIENTDYAIYRIRNIYDTVNVGVGRVQHWNITAADADGKDDIGSVDEGKDLIKDWSVDNDGIDVFVVDNNSIPGGILGFSPCPGPCSKNGKGLDGIFAGAVNRGYDGLSRTFAHEVGHYLGLPHNHGDDDCPGTMASCNRLMAQTGCANSCGSGVRIAVNLIAGEGTTMRGHCMAKDDC